MVGFGGATMTLALLISATPPLAVREVADQSVPPARPTRDDAAVMRARELVQQMTIDEKIGLVHGILLSMSKGQLKPGETRRVTLTAVPRVVADYDTRLPGWRIVGGRYRVAVARDATDRTLVGTVDLTGRTMRP